MRNLKREFYRCHSRYKSWKIYNKRYYERWFSHLQRNIIFPVLSRLQFIYSLCVLNGDSESCQLKKHIKIAYPSGGILQDSPPLGAKVIHTTRKETTSAVLKYGVRINKGSDEERKINEERILCGLREEVYTALDVPTWRNIKYPNAHIFDLVAKAGLRNSFIEDTCNSLLRKGEDVANADTVYWRLKKIKTEEWVRKWKEANKNLLLLARKRKLISALPGLSIDITPIMFYGDKEAYGVLGTQRKNGSCHAFKYMSACMSSSTSEQNEHFNLAALPLTEDLETWDAVEEVLKTSLQYVNHRFLVFMDREFYSTPVVNLMEKYKQKYLMPAKKTGPVKELIEKNPIPCVLPYTMHGKYGTADTTLVLVENDQGEVKAFATNLNVDASQAQKLFDVYKNRWTVDTSYRMVGQVRMNSKTLDFAVRWFLFFFSLIIINGYWLFNDFIKAYDHVTLTTFTEMFIEVPMALFGVKVVGIAEKGGG